MELNLVDKFILLALDDDKGTFAREPFALTYGLAGAILLELSFKEYIDVVDKKVILRNHKRVGDPFLDSCLEKFINSKKTLEHICLLFQHQQQSRKNTRMTNVQQKTTMISKLDMFRHGLIHLDMSRKRFCI